MVDDGSDDHTLSIANEFSSRGVFVASQKNRGAAAARNKALSFCSGDYIQWLDADDILAPDKISRQMEFAESCSQQTHFAFVRMGTFSVSHQPFEIHSDRALG